MPKARLADMDQDGIDTAVLFGGGPLGTANNELYIASFDAYNRWLADFCASCAQALRRRRLCADAGCRRGDRDDARSSARGLKAVNIPAFPMTKMAVAATAATRRRMALTGDANSERSYADPEFDPFWKAACDLGMPVTIHLGGRAVRFSEPKYFLPDLLMRKFGMAEPIAIMIFGGVFQRFPELRSSRSKAASAGSPSPPIHGRDLGQAALLDGQRAGT